MEETHYRSGEEIAFLKLVESSRDKKGKETGNIMFVLTEVYESVAGVDDHEQQAQNSLNLPHDMSEGLVELIICDRGAIKHSLWK